MQETTEFNYQGVQLRYNKETGQCWRQWNNGRWSLITPGTSKGIYTRVRIGKLGIKLHRIIAEVFLNGGNLLAADQMVDHIKPVTGDHAQDKLTNLRICTCGENLRNQGRNANNKSGFKGVCWHKSSSSWRAYITRSGVTIELGYFATPEAAAAAYDYAAEKLHGEFARLNFDTGSSQ